MSDAVFFCGDFNVDFLKADDVPTAYFNDLVDSLNVSRLINQLTRITKSTATLVDQIFVSDLSLVDESGVVVCVVSDHDLTYDVTFFYHLCTGYSDLNVLMIKLTFSMIVYCIFLMNMRRFVG